MLMKVKVKVCSGKFGVWSNAWNGSHVPASLGSGKTYRYQHKNNQSFQNLFVVLFQFNCWSRILLLMGSLLRLLRFLPFTSHHNWKRCTIITICRCQTLTMERRKNRTLRLNWGGISKRQNLWLIGPNIFITKHIRFQLQARHQLKQYEGRIKNIEEEHKQVLM